MANNNELNGSGPLSNWYKLNDTLRDCTEKKAEELLRKEMNGKGRERFLRRIHSRINRLRAERERLELRDGATERMAQR